MEFPAAIRLVTTCPQSKDLPREEYLARVEGVPFDVQTLLDAARRLEGASYEAVRLVRARDFAIGFEEAMRKVCGGG